MINKGLNVKLINLDVAIKLHINDNLIMYLSNGGEPNPDGTGGGCPSYFVSRRKLMINPVNVEICI